MKIVVWSELHNSQRIIGEYVTQAEADAKVKEMTEISLADPRYYKGSAEAGEYWNGPKYFTRIVFDE